MSQPLACPQARPVKHLSLIGLLIAVMLLSAAPAAAQGPAGQDLHTPVSSDGSRRVGPVPPAIVDGKNVVADVEGSYAPSSGGTGKQVKGGAQRRLDMTHRPDPQEQAGPESIIGSDDRYQITATTTYPYRAVVEFNFNQGSASYRCTGWLIGPDTVATAGHCVHSGGSGGVWSTNVVVYPGRNGSVAPYGSCGARYLNSVLGWTQSRDPEYDYGTIKLNCRIGDTVGWFGFRWTSSSLTNQSTAIVGFPGDKPYTMWRSDDFVRSTGVRQLFYANDTVGGMSGSPVYNGNAGCNPCGIAIHAYGLYGGSPYNRGTRITESVFNNLVAWKNAA